jgi:hypothetical protein
MAAGVLFAGTASAHLLTYEYEGEALFSVHLPDGWSVESAPVTGDSAATMVSLMPSDGELAWIGIWIIPDSESIEASIEFLRERAGEAESFKDAKVVDEWVKEKDIDGAVSTHVVTGTATYLDDPGEDAETDATVEEIPVVFAYNVFEISEDTVGVLCCISTPKGLTDHEKALRRLRESLHLAKE